MFPMSTERMHWTSLLSHTRLGGAPAAGAGPRSAFQRDFDRIVFSSAFRRLQDKTQVFPLAKNDYVRTRLTHSLEVASVGRSLGVLAGDHVLHQHPELCAGGYTAADFGAIVAAACLAHDIGNPPFGHAGEAAIQSWFNGSELGRSVLARLAAEEREDFARFEGNAQTFRILARLGMPDNAGGMQLTCATLAAVAKYPRAAQLPFAAPAASPAGSTTSSTPIASASRRWRRRPGSCGAMRALTAGAAIRLRSWWRRRTTSATA